MAEAARKLLPGRRGAEMSDERRELMEGLRRTRTLINQAYACFNCAEDKELIESYVFEINALHARYNYLLRQVKELGDGT